MIIISQFCDMTSSSTFFDVVLFFLSSLVTDPNFMSISFLVLELRQFSFIRDWPEIRKLEILTSVIKSPNIWRLGQVRGTKFGRNGSNKILLKAEKCQGYSFNRFELLRGNQQGGRITRPPPPPITHTPRLGLRKSGISLLLLQNVFLCSYVIYKRLNFLYFLWSFLWFSASVTV